MDSLTPGPKGERAGDDAVVLALSNLSESLSAADPQSAFQTVLDFVETFLGVQAAHLVLRNAREDRLVPAASRNLPQLAAGSVCVGEGVALAAMQGTEAVCIDDLASDPRDALGSLFSAGFHSTLCVPIMVANNGVGALLALSHRPRQFSVRDVDLLLELARAIAEAILAREPAWVINPPEAAQSDLRRSLDRHATCLGALQNLSVSLSEADTELLCQQAMLCFAEEALQAPGLFLAWDPQKQSLYTSTVCGLAGGQHEMVAEAALAAANQVLSSPDGFLLSTALEPAANQDRPLMCVVVRTRDHLAGVACLFFSTDPPGVDGFARSLATAAACQCAVAIDRLRMREEVARRTLQLNTMTEVGRTIGSMLDLGVVSEQIASQVCALTRSEHAILYYYDQINDRVRFAAASPSAGRISEDARDFARSVAGVAARYNRITTAGDLRDPESVRNVAGLNAANWYAMPVRHRNHRVAVVVCIPPRGAPADPAVTDQLENFGWMAAIAIQNARIYTREHAMARVMQESMLPLKGIAVEGLEIGHKMIPAHEVGGDFYDLIVLGRGRVGVAMADVAGSSVKAAAYTTVGKHALRAYAREYTCPAEVLRRLNRVICEESEAEIFISLFFGLIDIENGEMTFALAGHEPPLLLRAASNRFRQLTAKGMLLGVSRDADFERQAIALDPGDILVLYTDGLTETSFHGRHFGVDRLKDIVRRMQGRPIQDIVDAVVNERLETTQNRLLDDTTLAMLRRST